jgi:predicted nucleic acid-binding Zn ribbon protein
MEVSLICESCKKDFEGRPNRRTCSTKCRRILEKKRKFWDRKFGYVHFCQLQADWDTLSAPERASWQKKADEARGKLLKIYGERP